MRPKILASAVTHVSAVTVMIIRTSGQSLPDVIFNCRHSRLILTKLDNCQLEYYREPLFVFVMVCIFQVAILKEERSNLMVENEELYGKVREAQTLSRKDSVKAKQLETEVDHLKDEFDRLRALYVSTKDHMDSMEVSVTLHYIPDIKLYRQ